MTSDPVHQSVLAIFERHYPATLGRPETSYFIDTGDLDSFAHVELIAHVENAFGFKVADEDIGEENFGSIAAVVAYVRRRVAAA